MTLGTLGHFGFSLEGAAFLILFYLLIVIAFIDLEHLIIPDSLLLFCLGAWGLLIFKYPSWLSFYETVVGSVVFGGFLYMAGFLGKLLFKKEALGFGDIKLGFVLGAFLGWQLVVVSLYGAFFLAAIFAVMGLLIKKMKFGQMIPFGPFLILGCVGAVFLGERIIELFILWMLS
jgi:leader peptidase (prepilin peptidase)/N-methyltransferase